MAYSYTKGAKECSNHKVRFLCNRQKPREGDGLVFSLSEKTLHFDDPTTYLADLLAQANRLGATDLHFDPQPNAVQIRLRIDGLLHQFATLSSDAYLRLLVTIKMLAQMDIAEKRRPQDGSFHWEQDETIFDVRVASTTTVWGERCALRLLSAYGSAGRHRLDELGMTPYELDRFTQLVQFARGMVLCCGPVGSGKTTTLYAALSLRDAAHELICTLEDPVERKLPGITQVEVRPEIGLSFAEGLRALLRHDPDVLLVGEIRDKETAEVAVRAALTGHLVLATLHASDAVTAISRLSQMGVASYQVAEAVRGVVAQRLVRTRCLQCLGKEGQTVCNVCGGSGFFGRTGLFEVLALTEPLRKAVRDNVGHAELEELAVQAGMYPLNKRGEQLVEQGVTTAHEVRRCIGD